MKKYFGGEHNTLAAHLPPPPPPTFPTPFPTPFHPPFPLKDGMEGGRGRQMRERGRYTYYCFAFNTVPHLI